MSLNNYLQNIEPQEERTEQEIQIENNQNLEKLITAYEDWVKYKNINKFDSFEQIYEEANKYIGKLKHSAKEITEFSIKLKKYEHSDKFGETGVFLSALINNSEEQNFEIITEHLDKLIHDIGAHNTKNIVIKGNVGDNTGWKMIEGTITVYGNSGHRTGEQMKSGTITVKGKIKSYSPNTGEGRIIEIKE